MEIWGFEVGMGRVWAKGTNCNVDGWGGLYLAECGLSSKFSRKFSQRCFV